MHFTSYGTPVRRAASRQAWWWGEGFLWGNFGADVWPFVLQKGHAWGVGLLKHRDFVVFGYVFLTFGKGLTDAPSTATRGSPTSSAMIGLGKMLPTNLSLRIFRH